MYVALVNVTNTDILIKPILGIYFTWIYKVGFHKIAMILVEIQG